MALNSAALVYTPTVQSDIILSDSDKILAVATAKEWQIVHLFVEFISTDTIGNRQLELRILDVSSNIIFSILSGAVQAESLTRNYMFYPEAPNETSFNGNLIRGSIPGSLILPTGFQIRIFDNVAIDAGPLGADLVTNGDFATDTDWAKGAGWTISDGTASSDGSQGGDADLTEALSLTDGTTYEVVFTVTNYSAGNVTAVCADTEGTDRGANGTFTENILAGAGGDFDIRADINFIGDIDNVTVKDIGDDMTIRMLVLERDPPS